MGFLVSVVSFILSRYRVFVQIEIYRYMAINLPDDHDFRKGSALASKTDRESRCHGGCEGGSTTVLGFWNISPVI